MVRRFCSTRALLGMMTAALAVLPVGVQAQTPPAAAPADVVPVDPARLVAARITVDHIFPAGTYAKMLSGPMDKMMDSMLGTVGQMPLGELATIGGAKPEDVAKLSKSTLDDIMAIYDPAFHQRMLAATHAVMSEMGAVMSQIEPDIRDGLAHAYASRFTLDQLNDMNRFFATPSGDAYASNALLVQMDPAVMAKMQGFMPLMMKTLPDMMKKAKAATDALPKPRKLEDMTPAERSKLASLLGVPVATLEMKAATKTK